jgi:hypothetical protein
VSAAAWIASTVLFHDERLTFAAPNAYATGGVKAAVGKEPDANHPHPLFEARKGRTDRGLQHIAVQSFFRIEVEVSEFDLHG